MVSPSIIHAFLIAQSDGWWRTNLLGAGPSYFPCHESSSITVGVSLVSPRNNPLICYATGELTTEFEGDVFDPVTVTGKPRACLYLGVLQTIQACLNRLQRQKQNLSSMTSKTQVQHLILRYSTIRMGTEIPHGVCQHPRSLAKVTW